MECLTCNGSGYIMDGSEIPPMCEACNGTGFNLPNEKKHPDVFQVKKLNWVKNMMDYWHCRGLHFTYSASDTDLAIRERGIEIQTIPFQSLAAAKKAGQSHFEADVMKYLNVREVGK